MENIVVMKFGGKSLANLDLFKAVARYIRERIDHDPELRIVAVVSAMGDRTDRILANMKTLNPAPPERELAAALQVGEAESAPYLATALLHAGVKSASYNAFQLGIQTTGGHEEARITAVNREKLLRALHENQVVVVTGYQGVSENHDDELAILGRGGSDATAVAIGATLSCSVEFYKAGVAGVHAFDPRISRNARVLAHLTYDEALMLTEYGYEFLMTRSLEIARRFGVKLEFRQTPGLPLHDPFSIATTIDGGQRVSIEEIQENLCALAVKDNQAMLVISGVPDIPGWSDEIFDRIDVPFIDSYQVGVDGRAVVCIVAHNYDLETIKRKLANLPEVRQTPKPNLSNITLVDRTANSQSKLCRRIGRCLHATGVNIEGQYSSGIFIHTLVNREDRNTATLALAREFDLEETQVKSTLEKEGANAQD